MIAALRASGARLTWTEDVDDDAFPIRRETPLTEDVRTPETKKRREKKASIVFYKYLYG